MPGQGQFGLVLATVAGGLGALMATAPAGEKGAILTAPVRIGMVNSLFPDTPEATVDAMMQSFAAILESQTGLVGTLTTWGDAVQLGKMLTEDKVHLGVFPGIDFGWARQKCPTIRPLVIAVNQHRQLRALVLVQADAKIEKLADLQGKAFALPQNTREHCHLFLERSLQATGHEPKKLFAQITRPPTIEDALDDVVDNIVQGVLVDGVALDCYQRRKPGRFSKLKIVEKSEIFPPAVVAYRPGALDDATLAKFRDGMINANKGVPGRQFMTLWNMTGFEPMPADYDQIVDAIVKVYPAPVPAK
jgi:ABC-type phosphate/phosphonate transport system substrate-binding protein